LADGPLVAQLARARALGFLGPGPVEAHVDHGRAFVDALDGVDGCVVDLGSGGGVPGLVVALARPGLTVLLVDAMAKRCRFLRSAIEALGLEGVQVVEGRAEALGRGELRGTADAVLARSFGPPATTAECAAPLLRVGGRLLVSEPPDGPDRWPATELGELGLRAVGVHRGAGGTLQVLEQIVPCPDRYPRRDGVPAKRPLFSARPPSR
jgi:16S rRNA (guanine527-N7)-methyltransferase